MVLELSPQVAGGKRGMAGADGGMPDLGACDADVCQATSTNLASSNHLVPPSQQLAQLGMGSRVVSQCILPYHHRRLLRIKVFYAYFGYGFLACAGEVSKVVWAGCRYKSKEVFKAIQIVIFPLMYVSFKPMPSIVSALLLPSPMCTNLINCPPCTRIRTQPTEND
jgi:hypothetical protein